MALNVGLSASARIELLDNLLRHDRWWSKAELLFEVNRHVTAIKDKKVSEATLRNDLEQIAAIAADHLLCEKKGVKKIYRYDDRHYSIYNIQRPDPEDYDYFIQAIHLLRQIKGFDISEALKNLLLKIKYAFPQADDRPLVMLDGPERFGGMDWMQDVYDAICNRQVVHFLYQPFTDKEPQDFTLHPYLLKEYNNRWYLVGLAVPQQQIWVCALDRFKSYPKPRPSISFVAPEAVDFDAHRYFADVIGPTVRLEHPVEQVVIKVKAARVPYIITKPLHPSQHLQTTYKDGSAAFCFNLRYNQELLGTILSFGPDVRVIKPERLVQQVKAAIEKMAHQY